MTPEQRESILSNHRRCIIKMRAKANELRAAGNEIDASRVDAIVATWERIADEVRASGEKP